MRLLSRRPFITLFLIYLGSFLIFGIKAWSQSATASTTVTSTTVAPEKSSPSTTVTPAEKVTAKPTKPKKEPKNVFAVLETTKGKIKIKFFKDKAPKTVENFVGLAEGTKEYVDPTSRKKAKGKFFDGVIFHRVIPGFMIQTGDPMGTGFGGPGFTISDEIDRSLKHDKPGIVAMANTGRPNSAGSQFYITVSPQSHLDGGYTIFGEVVEGMDVVNAISAVKTDPSDKPLETVKITSVKIIKE